MWTALAFLGWSWTGIAWLRCTPQHSVAESIAAVVTVFPVMALVLLVIGVPL